ncbi:MAG TPA: polysaccharide deacetylase family protein, partial [Nitrososphaeraceae archaeon]|nr:polysaccharide deacetylase family protein [Nitrososphaeraceae archaeon]
MMNRYSSFGFTFFFFVIGYVGINNSTILYSNFINTIGLMLSIETFIKDIYYRNNYYIYDRNFISLDFKIPLANAQEQQTEKKDDINNNNNNKKEKTDKYVILVFDRGYKTTFTKAKPILDKYNFKITLFV